MAQLTYATNLQTLGGAICININIASKSVSLPTENVPVQRRLRCLFKELRLAFYITPSPSFNSLSKSFISALTPKSSPPSSSLFSFSSSRHLEHSHFPKPQASNSRLLHFNPLSGLTYEISSSSPGSISRFATTVIRDNAVR